MFVASVALSFMVGNEALVRKELLTELVHILTCWCITGLVQLEILGLLGQNNFCKCGKSCFLAKVAWDLLKWWMLFNRKCLLAESKTLAVVFCIEAS